MESCRGPYMGHTNASGWVMVFFYTKVSFFENLMKKFESGWSSSRCGNFVKKWNFVCTPWKIIIALGNSVGDHIWVIQIHMGA